MWSSHGNLKFTDGPSPKHGYLLSGLNNNVLIKTAALLFLIKALYRSKEPEESTFSAIFGSNRDKFSKILAAMIAYRSILASLPESIESDYDSSRSSTVFVIPCEIPENLMAALTTDSLFGEDVEESFEEYSGESPETQGSSPTATREMIEFESDYSNLWQCS